MDGVSDGSVNLPGLHFKGSSQPLLNISCYTRHLANSSMRMTSSAGIAVLGKQCNEVDMDTTEGAQMNVCCRNTPARVIRVYTTQLTYARFPPLKLGTCFVSAISHFDCLIIYGGSMGHIYMED